MQVRRAAPSAPIRLKAVPQLSRGGSMSRLSAFISMAACVFLTCCATAPYDGQ